MLKGVNGFNASLSPPAIHSIMQGFSEPLFIMLASLDKRLKVLKLYRCYKLIISWLQRLFAGADVTRHKEGFNC